MQIILDDTLIKDNLYPFTLTRSAAGIRIGILTIREKWEMLLGRKVRVNRDDEMFDDGGETPPAVFSANIIPSKAWFDKLRQEGATKEMWQENELIRVLRHPWQIFEFNDWALRQDFAVISHNRHSAPISETVQAMNVRQIFIEEGAKVHHCLLNANTGPIYIGKNAEVMEGALIRGPFSLGEGSVVKMGAKIYGATTIGPHCVVGGEIKNAVIFGNSNKAHDGYLGDSVVGEWCNLGAGTSNSNIKNTAGDVKAWSEPDKDFIPVGLKCGLLMGDYSRAAINTSFNTGTVAGVCCNIYDSGLTPKHIPSFSWGKEGSTLYNFEKALIDIANWKKLKNQSLSEKEIQTLQHIFEQSQSNDRKK